LIPPAPASPSNSRETWATSFTAAGRPGRAAALARFLDYLSSFDTAWICRRVDIARHWIEHFPSGEA
jgi:hypothetical protein